SRKKFGNYIYKNLRSKGYSLFPVHPTAETIEGDKTCTNLASLPEDVKAAIIAISPARAETVIDDAVRGGIKRLWFQSGANFSRAAEKAREAGIDVVTGKCILMYAEPVKGFHAFHRFLARIFGRL
ncbi:MAG: CoA-binding protein, partial [Candidatus Zixiibacteriota bacterium]